jgi:hypothetical protein
MLLLVITRYKSTTMNNTNQESIRSMDEVLQLLQEQEQNLREFCHSQEEHIQILVQEQQTEEPQPPAQFEDAIKKVIHLRRILKEQEDNLRRRQERPDNFMVAIIRTLFDI